MKKNKILKRSAIVMLVAFSLLLIPNKTVKAEVLIDVNQTNFPDDIFRSYISTNFDEDNDGKLSTEEVNSVTSMYYYGKDLKNVSGIEYFTELEEIEFRYASITSINVTNMPKLKELILYYSSISSLDITNNPKLELLDITHSLVLTLDISKNPALIDLVIRGTELKKVDLSNNPNIELINLKNSAITSIDTTNLPNFKYLSMQGTKIKSIDVSKNPELKYIGASDSSLEVLDVKNNAKITAIEINGTPIKEVDLSKNVNLEWFAGSSNLNSLNFDNCPNLKIIDIPQASIAILDLINNKKIYSISLGDQNTNLPLAYHHSDKSFTFDFKTICNDLNRLSIPSSTDYEYNSSTGIIKFTGETGVVNYTFDTGYNNQLLNVTANFKVVYELADYSKLNEAITNIPKNLDIYTTESVNVLKDALAKIIWDKKQNEQDSIDKYTTDVLDGIKNLKLKPTTPSNNENSNSSSNNENSNSNSNTGNTNSNSNSNTSNTNSNSNANTGNSNNSNPITGDSSNSLVWLISILSSSLAFIGVRRAKIKA